MFRPAGGSSSFDTYSTTATAAGTTTLVNTSNYKQFFTGVTTQTVVLPVASTMSLGQQFLVVNDSSGVVTVQSSGANTLQAMIASSEMLITCILLSGTGTASWSWDYQAKGTVPVSLGGIGLTSTSATINQILKGAGSSLNPYWGTPNPINYISNGDGEINATTGWANFADAAAATPVDLTGGSPVTAIAVSASSPLRGTYSFTWVKSANNRQGEGVSYAFTIDAADQGKVLNISFDYLLSGTYVSNDLGIWVYDVTNSTLIQPAPYNILNASVAQSWTGVFQAASNSTSYRVGIYCQSTSASAYTLQWDNFVVGPQRTAMGPAMTDPTSYTPTIVGMGTVTGVAAEYWRDGKNLYVDFRFTSGTNTGVNATISLPTGLVFDNSVASTNRYWGTWGSSATPFSGNMLSLPGTSTTVMFFASGAANFTSQIVGNTWANTTTIGGSFCIPIVGWSSNSVLSADADTRVVAGKLNDTTGATYTSAATTVVPYNTLVFDTHGAVSTGSSSYTVKVPGYYRVEASMGIAGGTTTSGNAYILNCAVNTTTASSARWTAPAGVAATVSVAGSFLVSCVAGDVIDMRFAGTFASGTLTFVTGANGNYFSVSRLTGPAQIAASESVNCRYTNTAGSTLTKSAANTVPFATKDYDSHNAFVTDTFTCPMAGKYAIKSHLLIATGATWANGDFVQIEVLKNGTANSGAQDFINATITGGIGIQISATVNCIAGDTLKINCNPTKAAAGNVTLNTTAGYNHFTIERIGN